MPYQEIQDLNRQMLKNCLEYIGKDELVEITPKNVRIRKLHLKEVDLKRAERIAEGIKFDY